MVQIMEINNSFSFSTIHALCKNMYARKIQMSKNGIISNKRHMCHIAHLRKHWKTEINCVNIFYLFRKYLPLGKGVALYLNKLASPSQKDTLCQV